jgi:hypothetical protein
VEGLLWHELLSSEAVNATEILNYRTYLTGYEVYVGYLALRTNCHHSSLLEQSMPRKVERQRLSLNSGLVTPWFRHRIASIPMIVILLLGLFRHVDVIML